MSMHDRIVLYGIDVNNLNVKDYLEFYNMVISGDDEIGTEMQKKFLSRSVIDNYFYIGFCPRFPWNKEQLPYKTEDEAKNIIADFLEKYVNNTREEILKNIGEAEAVKW